MRVLLLGRHEMLYETGQRLLAEGRHQIVAVVTAPERPEYRRKASDFRFLAKKAGAAFLVAKRIDAEVLKLVRDTRPDIGVSINWVSLVDSRLTEIVPHGILNAHLGDLPRYRGNAVPNWALLRGEKKVVLTIHRMEPDKLDDGPILQQRAYKLRPATTIADIIGFAEATIPELYARAIDGMAAGKSVSKSPRGGLSAGFRCYPRLPRDGAIDWTRPAVEIDALVRSLVRPYSGAYTHYRDADGVLRRLFVWRTRIVSRSTRDLGVPGHVVRNDSTTGESHIFTGRGVLAILESSHDDEIETFAPGRLWKSIRMRLGLSLEDEIYNLTRAVGRDARGFRKK
jgi:methionyl-tRNA formyltransferase